MTKIVKTKTFNFDQMLLQQAQEAAHPAAIAPLIRMAKQAGAKNTAKALQQIERRLKTQAVEYVEPSVNSEPIRGSGSCTEHGSVILNDGSVIAW